MQSADAGLSRKALERLLTIVFITVFLDMIGFGLVLPLLPLYVSRLGGSAQTVGFIFSSFAFTQLLATPLLGRISDRYGRRPVILLSLVGNAAAMLVFAMADQLWLLFLSRILAGATSGNLAACQAAIADVTTREERARGMGRLGAGIGLGMVLGPFVGGVLARFGTWAPPTAAAAMALLDLALAFFWMPETRRLGTSSSTTAAVVDPPAAPAQKATLWAVLSERQLSRVLALYFLSFLCLSNMQVALALLARARLGWGEAQIGYIFGGFGLVTLIVQGALIGRLVRFFGELNLVLLGAISVGVGMVIIATAHQPWTVIAGSLFFSLGIAVNNPSISSLASRYARSDQQGAVLGFAQSAGGLARAIGPSWSGFLFARLNPGAPFLGGAVIAALWLLVGQSLKNGSRTAAPVPGSPVDIAPSAHLEAASSSSRPASEPVPEP